MSCKHPTKPCKNCPFSRSVEPGALGGSDPRVYIGQANGPFWLPCHAAYDESRSAKDQDPANIGQCAGAATYRANTGVIPASGLHRLPANTDSVFSSAAEFMAHHKGITVEEADDELATLTPDVLTAIELRKAAVKVHLIPRG